MTGKGLFHRFCMSAMFISSVLILLGRTARFSVKLHFYAVFFVAYKYGNSPTKKMITLNIDTMQSEIDNGICSWDNQMT